MKRVFVVDDSNINLAKADEALSDHYDVITVASASTMFELIDHIIPDIILLDIMMPEMDGFEALELLKSNTKYKDIPVIFLTGKNDADTETRGFEAGVVDFIEKPFSKPVLIDRIEAVLKSDMVNS